MGERMRPKKGFTINTEEPIYEVEDVDSSSSSDIIEITNYDEISPQTSSTCMTRSCTFTNTCSKKQKLQPPELIQVEENVRMEIDEEAEDPLNLDILPGLENSKDPLRQIEPVKQEKSATVTPPIKNNFSGWFTNFNIVQAKDSEKKRKFVVNKNRHVPTILKASKNKMFTVPTFVMAGKIKASRGVATDFRNWENNVDVYDKETQVEETLLMSTEEKNVNIEILTNLMIFKRPYLYTGLYGNAVCEFINMIMKRCSATARDILMILMKIRQNDSFGILEDIFGIPDGKAGDIFKRVVPKVSDCLKFSVLQATPDAVQFSSCHKKIHSVIDYFQVKTHESNDWRHNNCETVKFLISITSNGIINFVSRGFSENEKDFVVLTNSDYLQNVQVGSAVIANRNFYGIGGMIRRKNCMFIQGDSPEQNFPGISGEDLLNYRKKLKVVLESFREFQFIGPNACVPKNQSLFLHQIMIIAAAIVNSHRRKVDLVIRNDMLEVRKRSINL